MLRQQTQKCLLKNEKLCDAFKFPIWLKHDMVDIQQIILRINKKKYH